MENLGGQEFFSQVLEVSQEKGKVQEMEKVLKKFKLGYSPWKLNVKLFTFYAFYLFLFASLFPKIKKMFFLVLFIKLYRPCQIKKELYKIYKMSSLRGMYWQTHGFKNLVFKLKHRSPWDRIYWIWVYTARCNCRFKF